MRAFVSVAERKKPHIGKWEGNGGDCDSRIGAGVGVSFYQSLGQNAQEDIGNYHFEMNF
jgi:hypothetical protein